MLTTRNKVACLAPVLLVVVGSLAFAVGQADRKDYLLIVLDLFEIMKDQVSSRSTAVLDCDVLSHNGEGVDGKLKLTVGRGNKGVFRYTIWLPTERTVTWELEQVDNRNFRLHMYWDGFRRHESIDLHFTGRNEATFTYENFEGTEVLEGTCTTTIKL
jgi:hypothetical protein